MIISGTGIDELNDAMSRVQKVYPDAEFKEVKRLSSNRVQFTLRVKHSDAKGAHRSMHSDTKKGYKRTTSACWHLHRDFFDALPEGRRVTSSYYGSAVIETGNYGTYPDFMVGSMYRGFYMMSEMCACDEIDENEVA